MVWRFVSIIIVSIMPYLPIIPLSHIRIIVGKKPNGGALCLGQRSSRFDS